MRRRRPRRGERRGRAPPSFPPARCTVRPGPGRLFETQPWARELDARGQPTRSCRTDGTVTRRICLRCLERSSQRWTNQVAWSRGGWACPHRRHVWEKLMVGGGRNATHATSRPWAWAPTLGLFLLLLTLRQGSLSSWDGPRSIVWPPYLACSYSPHLGCLERLPGSPTRGFWSGDGCGSDRTPRAYFESSRFKDKSLRVKSRGACRL